MEIDLSEVLAELLELKEAEEEAHAVVERLQEEFSKNGPYWPQTDEQHVVWQNAWEDWRVPWEELDDTLTYHAETLGLDRGELEAALQQAAAHAAPPVAD
ncbi:hypothetical protein [Streptomyces sp. NPDC048349]|uniref:hypothetical protein n=1 Tax=Streptomyces sp. NPDC048349 TaxID=3155486 RepID=UPI003417E78B